MRLYRRCEIADFIRMAGEFLLTEEGKSYIIKVTMHAKIEREVFVENRQKTKKWESPLFCLSATAWRKDK